MRIDTKDVAAIMEAVNAHLVAAHKLRLMDASDETSRMRAQLGVANTLNDLSRAYMRAIDGRKKASAVSEGLRGNSR